MLTEPRYSHSVERGLAILECFTPERPVWGLVEIADELGMSRSTTHRYMLTLTTLGYLEQGPRRKYRITPAVTKLGPHLIAAADLLSARLGYRRADQRVQGRPAHVAPARVEAAAGETLA